MLSIIIVNYFGKEVLKTCIESVIQYTKDISYEIIVVDNAQDTQTRQMLEPLMEHIQWVDMGYNSGFGRANNKAFSLMKGDAALLLNPDCVAFDNAIGDSYKTFMQSEYAACGIQLQHEDGSFQISGNYAMKGGLNYLLPLPYLGNILKSVATLAGVKKPHNDTPSSIVEVDWINGAFLMVKKTSIDKTHGFDEDFFLYAEEAEWCARLKKEGKLCIYGAYKITHMVGALSTEAFGGESNSYYTLYDRKGLQIMVSNLVRIRKEFGLGWFLLILSAYTFTIPFYLVMGIFHSLFSFKNQLRHFPGFSANVLQIWRFVPIIIKNKPHFYKVL
ncbi:glycosyltransferase family 2 protein [Taibaiella sp. KBW10]|uniref:glycosyltransferase family 2 protein n=1 Tax=Taibaiella sp. KBW10 TaxID=2153357 RepID=UPI000F590346|nr:glycosyltransferase family 2 protein [Taibaiella sp. KBW10]RQO30244.1 glycosyltransferase family 2 protein [Taibaiella sp. KBW10]